MENPDFEPLDRDLVLPDFDLGADTYRRRIRVRTAERGVVVSELEDDFHHFIVTLRHDGERVVSAEGESRRWPWATCPDASVPLRALAGMPLARRFTAAGRWTEPRQNCTHQFDAACHAITHAASRRELRVYDVEVPRRDPETGATHVRLWVDGEQRLEWDLHWFGLVDPRPPFDDAPWKGGFMRWADATLPEDDAEIAITMRRACDIGMGRGMPLDEVPRAADLTHGMGGICYSLQPEIAPVAFRHVGSIRDFASAPERLLDD